MNTKIKSVLAAASVLALSAITANAQLLLVSTNSTFQNVLPSPANVTVTNGGLNTASSISYSPLSSTTFTLTTTPQAAVGLDVLANLAGNTFDKWLVDYNATAGTTANVSQFDFKFDLDFQGGSAIDLSLLFRVAVTYNTTNNGIPRVVYNTTSVTPLSGTFAVGTGIYSYEVNAANGLSGSVVSGSNNSAGTANLDIAFARVAVPEPSTYALFGVAALMGVVAVRRFRSSKKVA